MGGSNSTINYGSKLPAHYKEIKDIPDADLLSPCYVYEIMHEECKRLASKATSVYVSGEKPNCDELREVCKACNNWTSSKEQKDLETMLQYERKLFQNRQISNYMNNVWIIRDEPHRPPPTFSAPLPDDIAKRSIGMLAKLLQREPLTF